MGDLMSPERRLAALMARTEPQADGCLYWTGSRNRQGYGTVGWDHVSYLAHRLVYILARGPIPDDLPFLDHVCHSRVADTCTDSSACLHRRCINPDHLEPVTPRENRRRAYPIQRATCVNGHPRTPKNTYIKRGARFCRDCNSDAVRRYKQRKSA